MPHPTQLQKRKDHLWNPSKTPWHAALLPMKESRALKISRVKVNKAKSVIKKAGNTLEKSGSSPNKWLNHSTRPRPANNFTPGIDLNIQPLRSRGAAIKKIALPRTSTQLVLHKITLCKDGKDRAIFGNIFISEETLLPLAREPCSVFSFCSSSSITGVFSL